MVEKRNIVIVLTNGKTVEWESEEYTDYIYDGKCFIVVHGCEWVGIYNIDHVISVETKG